MKTALSSLILTLVFSLLVISIGWPGITYTDTYFHYADILNGIWTNWHSPLITATWSLLEKFSNPPGNYFVTQLLFSLSALIIWFSLENKLNRIIVSSLVFFTPPIWMSTAILWKDVLMMYALLAGFALLCLYQKKKSKIFLITSFIAFILACSFRVNAFFALPPLLYVLFPKWWKTILVTALIAFIGNGVNALLTTEKKFTAQTLLNYDLVGILANDGDAHLPRYHEKNPYFSLPSALSQYNPEGVNRLFYTPHPPLIFTDNKEAYRELEKLWREGIIQSPIPYLKHRSDTFLTLLRWQKHSHFYYAYQLKIGKNPWNWELADFPLRDFLRNIVRSTKDSYFYTPWMFILVGLIFLLLETISWIRSKVYSRDFALILSAFFYLIPLFFITPAFDFRYTLWVYLAIHLSIVSFLLNIRLKNFFHNKL